MDVFTRSWKTLVLEAQPGIAIVRLNRPDRRNAMSLEMMRELTECAQALKPRTDVHAVVLTGGDEYFTAGADLNDPERAMDAGKTLLEQRQVVLAGPDMCDAWEALEQTFVCLRSVRCLVLLNSPNNRIVCFSHNFYEVNDRKVFLCHVLNAI